MKRKRVSSDGMPSAQILVDWIAHGLSQDGKSASGLAAVLGLSPSQGSKIMRGVRPLAAHELPTVSEYLGLPVPPLGISSVINSVAVIADISESIWYEASAFGDVAYPAHTRTPVPAVPDQRFDGLSQFATKVSNVPLDGIDQPDSYAICVPYHKIRKEPVDGDLVTVEIVRSGLYRPALFRMIRTKTGWELRPPAGAEGLMALKLSPDLRKIIGGDHIELVEFRGLVIGQYVPVNIG